MDIASVLSKLNSADAAAFDGVLEADEVAFLRDFDVGKYAGDIRKASETRATRKASAAAETLQAELDALTAERDELSAQLESGDKDGKKGGPDPKTQKQIETLTKQVETLTAEREQIAKDRDGLARNGALDKIRAAAKVDFVESVDPEIAGGAWSRAFADIDTEDLTDETVTGPVITAFKEKNLALIRAASSNGTGGTGSDGRGGQSHGTKSPEDQSDAERTEALAGMRTAGVNR